MRRMTPDLVAFVQRWGLDSLAAEALAKESPLVIRGMLSDQAVEDSLRAANNKSSKMMSLIKKERARLKDRGQRDPPAAPAQDRERDAEGEGEYGDEVAPGEGEGLYDSGYAAPEWSGEADGAGEAILGDSPTGGNLTAPPRSIKDRGADEGGGAAAAASEADGGGSEDDEEEDELLRELQGMKDAEGDAEKRLHDAAKECQRAWEEAQAALDDAPAPDFSSDLFTQEEQILSTMREALAARRAVLEEELRSCAAAQEEEVQRCRKNAEKVQKRCVGYGKLKGAQALKAVEKGMDQKLRNDAAAAAAIVGGRQGGLADVHMSDMERRISVVLLDCWRAAAPPRRASGTVPAPPQTAAVPSWD